MCNSKHSLYFDVTVPHQRKQSPGVDNDFNEKKTPPNPKVPGKC